MMNEAIDKASVNFMVKVTVKYLEFEFLCLRNLCRLIVVVMTLHHGSSYDVKQPTFLMKRMTFKVK